MNVTAIKAIKATAIQAIKLISSSKYMPNFSIKNYKTNNTKGKETAEEMLDGN